MTMSSQHQKTSRSRGEATNISASHPDDESLDSPTNNKGMVDGDEASSKTSERSRRSRPRRSSQKRRQPIEYVSKHFTDEVSRSASPDKSTASAPSYGDPDTQSGKPALSKPGSRIYYGMNVDDLSSDSELSDLPSDFGPDPFENRLTATPKSKSRKKSQSTKSPYFPSTPHRHRQHFLSTLPFPPLSRLNFGLMQEKLAHSPFRLLVATIFLNKTPGERAMPVFYQLMERYPTPSDLSRAEVANVTSIIQCLGFQNQRARKCVALAKMWCEHSPKTTVRWKKVDYPKKGDGRNVKEGEQLAEDDERVGWEIGHLPGLGAYAHDSWRMFCRDVFLGKATGWNGEGAEEDFEPEWKRVLPLDKELRAWMTWMWLKEGWLWNKETGERKKADDELMRLARGGGIVVEEREKESLTVQSVGPQLVHHVKETGRIGKPAGEVLEEVVVGKRDAKLTLDTNDDMREGGSAEQ